MAAREGIKHVIVLMLENRSFDCMLGQLYPSGPRFNGLTGNETNPLGAGLPPVLIQPSARMDAYAVTIPKPDPGEKFAEMNEQLFGPGADRSAGQPPMTGFVVNYLKRAEGVVPNPFDMMHYFKADQLPVIIKLAKAFGVSDQWHASAPCQTWPNRFFAHTGTCHGRVNNTDFAWPPQVPFPAPSIFGRLSGKGLD
jgi:phospholipase C